MASDKTSSEVARRYRIRLRVKWRGIFLLDKAGGADFG
jgi:hypothetical protein